MKTGQEETLGKKSAPWNFEGGMVIGLVAGFILGLIQGDVLEGLGFGVLIGLAIGAAFERRDQMMQYPPRQARHVVLAAVLFMGAAVAWSTWIKVVTQPQMRWVVSLAPGLTFLFFVLAIGLAIASLDELQRRIQTEAIAIGFGLTAVVVTTIGFLGELGLAQPNGIFIVLIMIVGWVIGKAWTIWKYR